MGETRKIVVERYPVEKLPEDLRQRLGSVGLVTVTLEETDRIPVDSPAALLRSLLGSAPGRYHAPEDIVREIRELRDEWEH